MLAMLPAVARLAGVLVLGAVVGSGAAPTAVVATANHNPPSGSVGRDVGAVSCEQPLPTGASFGIIAATNGRPYYASPCLSSEYAWSGGLPYRRQYYLNLADPGHGSPHWGQGGPRLCHRFPKYGAGCAFDYGWKAAASAWGFVSAVGAPGSSRWWLDVEIDNTWGYGTAGVQANDAVIRGALAYLRQVRHVTVGIYTETLWWDYITNGSTSFSDVPVWGGGANSKRHAASNCLKHSITGGPALLAQWISDGADHDLAC